MGEAQPIAVEYNVTPAESGEARAALAAPRWPVGRPLTAIGRRARAFLGPVLFLGCAALLYFLQKREATNLLIGARDAAVHHSTVALAAGGSAVFLLAGVIQAVHAQRRQLRS